MKYLLVTILAIAAVMLCIEFVQYVPGATTDGHFTDDFWLNTFFMVLGFLVTTAAISPMVALFLEWRDDRAWRSARLNARNRFAAALEVTLANYCQFLATIRDGDPHGLASLFLTNTQQGLSDLFDTYQSEQGTLNADMHSAASNIRQHLLPFKRAIESTQAMIGRLRPHRVYVRRTTLNDLRAVFEHPPIDQASLVTANTYFAQFGEVFFDLRLDLQLGAGVISIDRFVSIDPALLQLQWSDFSKAAPSSDDATSVPAFDQGIQADARTQAEVHATYVRQHVAEPYLVDTLLHRDLLP